MHRTKGLYRVLERPSVYERFQKMLGADRVRARFVEEFLRPFAGARLIDAGCGTGSLLDYLPAGVEYVGFDPNPRYIEAARARYGARGTFFCARTSETAPFEEAAFDIVVAKSLLHHLSDGDAHALLASARRWLRPGGAFVSSDGVVHARQRTIARLLTALDRGANVRTPEGYRALATPYFLHVESWLMSDMAAIPYDHFILRAS
ncbi:MAG: class I SAM-dependent methyltransferase [Acidobacteria bacterium]|nr:class I SAM-dependent methyltransferase [Acidobacteriota bacterium]MBV9476220.1 class I SAM-dependent methyltransferase [Acidobacteriota bacterium]